MLPPDRLYEIVRENVGNFPDARDRETGADERPPCDWTKTEPAPSLRCGVEPSGFDDLRRPLLLL